MSPAKLDFDRPMMDGAPFNHSQWQGAGLHLPG
jgi:hypothetical protein